jgi:hypothetical protein
MASGDRLCVLPGEGMGESSGQMTSLALSHSKWFPVLIGRSSFDPPPVKKLFQLTQLGTNAVAKALDVPAYISQSSPVLLG